MSRRRQEIYDRIRTSSKDEVILEEMIRLGFWRSDSSNIDDPTHEIRRRAQLERELAALRTEQSRLHNMVALVREAQKRKLAESRQKRRETKERRLRERYARAERWRERKGRELLYLGAGVSGGLGRTDSDMEGLRAQGLPELSYPAGVARGMGIPMGQLRFLAYKRDVSQTNHYKRFTIAKRSGGRRLITAPMARLKKAQRWILDNVLAKVPLHKAAHGFRPGRSIVTNASPHVGAEVVINMDLKDFFPTVTYKRTRGTFKALGYSEAVSTVFALLCTEPEIETVTLDGVVWHVAVGERRLPQGAPTSPALTNIICRRLDVRLTALAEAFGFVYTRYADDLTFSAQTLADEKNIGRVLRRAKFIVAGEGFVVHPDKTRILRRARQQEVTGLVVNDRVGVPRKTLRRFRALLFQIDKDGPAGKQWQGVAGDGLFPSIMGYADFVYMVDPGKGEALRQQIRGLMHKYGYVLGHRASPTPAAPVGAALGGGPAPGPGQAAAGEGVIEAEVEILDAEVPVEAPAPTSTPEEDPPEPAKKKKWWKLF